jgi:nucleolar protein 12
MSMHTPSSGSGSSALADMFSDVSRTKFERKVKPAELIPTKRIDPNVEKKVKKKKWSKIAKENEAKAAAAAASGAGEDGDDSDHVTQQETDQDTSAKADQQKRTVFMGNIPLTQTIKDIKTLCSEFGKVDSVRLRSVPAAGTKVDEAGNQDLVRKICANHRQFGDQKGTFNAYVVFKDEASVAAALRANNRVLEERHLRFDTANPSLFDPKKTVFVGSLQHYCDEEALRQHFADVSPRS